MASDTSLSWGWFQPSPLPDVATGQTVAFMCGCIDRASVNPLVMAAARDAVARFGALAGVAPGGRPSSADLARAVFWWVKYAVEPMRHSQFKALVSAFPEKKQLIVDPVALLGMDRPAGDCSAFTMLVCALLRSLGVRYELVTVAVDPEDPALFTHVYPRAVLETGADVRVLLPLDAHAGAAPGWEVLAQDVFRKQVWDAHGQPIPDSVNSSRFTGLHEYISRGVGQDDSTDLGIDVTYDPSTGLYQDTGTTSPLGAITIQAPADSYTVSATPLPASGTVAPSQSSAAWANFATQLSKAGLTLAEINAIQPGTVVGANGQILRQATGLPVPVGSGVTAALGSGGSTMLLLIVAGLAVVFMLSKKS